MLELLDYTSTAVGRRLLRTTLQLPPNSRATVELRQQAVRAIMKDTELFYGLEGEFVILIDRICLFVYDVTVTHEL